MRHRTDNNQKSIVDAMREAGATIKDTSSVGGGFPDIVAGRAGDQQDYSVYRMSDGTYYYGKMPQHQNDVLIESGISANLAFDMASHNNKIIDKLPIG